MNVTVERLPKSQAKLTVTLDPEEIKPALEKTARHISEHLEIAGFRKGKAPFDVVMNKYGAAALYQEAAEEIVRQTYPQAVLEQKLDAVGHPHVSIQKVAPDNPFVYTATVALLPAVTLGEYKKVKARRKDVKIDKQEVDKVLADLRQMRAKEVLVDRPAKAGDRVDVDLHLSVAGVPLEDGVTKNQAVHIGRRQVVPGLEEQLIGLKKGDQKSFPLSYPKEHYQKHLAGKTVDFAVTANAVYQVDEPALDDAFAQGLGKFDTVVALEKQIEDNLRGEAGEKERQRFEMAMLQEVVDGATFGEIPDLLLESELDRMVHELRHGIEQQGLTWDAYLAQLKKTEAALRTDFTDQALKRIKSTLVLRQIRAAENLTLTDDEIAKELERQKEQFKDDLPTYNKIDSPEYRDYLESVLLNRKVFEYLERLAYPKP